MFEEFIVERVNTLVQAVKACVGFLKMSLDDVEGFGLGVVNLEVVVEQFLLDPLSQSLSHRLYLVLSQRYFILNPAVTILVLLYLRR